MCVLSLCSLSALFVFPVSLSCAFLSSLSAAFGAADIRFSQPRQTRARTALETRPEIVLPLRARSMRLARELRLAA